MIKDALSAGNAIVATLLSLSGRAAHAVMIYGCANEEFKIKDSYGKKYKIPIDRPDYYQVIKLKHKRLITIQIYLGQAF